MRVADCVLGLAIGIAGAAGLGIGAAYGGALIAIGAAGLGYLDHERRIGPRPRCGNHLRGAPAQRRLLKGVPHRDADSGTLARVVFDAA
jgi:hypothetical protein